MHLERSLLVDYDNGLKDSSLANIFVGFRPN